MWIMLHDLDGKEIWVNADTICTVSSPVSSGKMWTFDVLFIGATKPTTFKEASWRLAFKTFGHARRLRATFSAFSP